MIVPKIVHHHTWGASFKTITTILCGRAWTPNNMTFLHIHVNTWANIVNNMMNITALVIIQAFVHRSAHERSEVNFILRSWEALIACPFSNNIALRLLTDACNLWIIMAFSALIRLRLNQTSCSHLLCKWSLWLDQLREHNIITCAKHISLPWYN